MKYNKKLKSIYNNLYAHFGPQYWWPAKNAFEVAIGAILTQNTSWSNVERAIKNLKAKNLLSAYKIKQATPGKLQAAIKSSGFYKQKSKKLKVFAGFLCKEYGCSMSKMMKEDTRLARQKLLRLKGIGPETADSILLYALKKPVFVIDAYTKRIFSRHKLITPHADYREIQKFFVSNLTRSAKVFNEYHALIVAVGKNYCKKTRPNCDLCPFPGNNFSIRN